MKKSIMNMFGFGADNRVRVEERKFGNIEKVRDPSTGCFRSVRMVDYTLIPRGTVIVVGHGHWHSGFEFVRVGTVQETLQAREVAETEAVAERNKKKCEVMKKVNANAGKTMMSELAQENALLSGSVAGTATHKDRIIALRKERARLDAEERDLMNELAPEHADLEERLKALKRPRCELGSRCKSVCVLDHDEEDEGEPVQTAVKPTRTYEY